MRSIKSKAAIYKWFTRKEIEGNPDIVEDVQRHCLAALDELARE